MFGQDVEPHGTYVLEKDFEGPISSPWVQGTAELNNPLIINITSDTQISYKYDLAKEYKAKGKSLTKKLMGKGYDGIITRYPNGESNEIVLFPNARFMLHPISEVKTLIKKKLNENFTNKLIENFLEEDYPTNFDRGHFRTLRTFKDRIAYCESNLKRLSSGSGRIVYMIDDEKVLKLSKNQKGVAQTEVEADWGQQDYFSSILAHTFEYQPDYLWIEMELARKVNKAKFKELAGCDIDDMYFYLHNFYESNNGRTPRYRISPETQALLDENYFTGLVREFMVNTDSGPGDFGNLSSYGIVKRDGEDDLVIIDFGLTNAIYNTYYS